MRKLLATIAVAALLIPASAFAQYTYSPGQSGAVGSTVSATDPNGNPRQVVLPSFNCASGCSGSSGGGSTVVGPGVTTMQRPNNSNPYSQNQVICQSTTGASCVWTIYVASSNNNTGTLSTFTLWKSTAAAASFAMDLYSVSPTVTTISAGDQAADLGPVTADASNYEGTYICQTTLPTNDSGAFYACAPQSPGPGGVQFKTASNQPYVYGILRVTSSSGYNPGAQERFTVVTSAYQDH